MKGVRCRGRGLRTWNEGSGSKEGGLREGSKV